MKYKSKRGSSEFLKKKDELLAKFLAPLQSDRWKINMATN
jgi:hypothetical protein